MQVKLLCFAALSLASSAFAQCGTSQLTTTFASNNGGSAGGAVYFTLDVLAPNGISICAIDVNTSLASGPIAGTVYRHTSLTDPFALTTANNVAANWAALCGVTGTANGTNQLSPMTVVSGTNTLDLPQGQHLLAIASSCTPSWAHRYTNVVHTAAIYTQPGELTFVGGRATNIAFSGSLFGSNTTSTSTARVANLRFDYTVPATPVVATPPGFVAVCHNPLSVGAGCGGVPFHVHEEFTGTNAFDLGSSDLIFTNAGVVAAPATPIVAAVGPDLGLGDDTSTAFLPLGFTLTLGSNTYSDISIASNGYIRFDAGSPAGDFTQSAATFHSQGARLCPYWDDLRPLSGGGAGTVHADFSPGQVLITFDQVLLWGTTNVVTFQVEITPNIVIFRYDGSTALGNSLIGYANAVAEPPLPPVDYTAGPTGPITGSANMELLFVQLPKLGGSFDMLLDNNPGLGGVLAQIGLLGAPTPLSTPPFAVNCNQYVGTSTVSLGLTTAQATAFSIAMPNLPGLLNLPFGVQGAGIGGGTVVTSNGLQVRLGTL